MQTTLDHTLLTVTDSSDLGSVKHIYSHINAMFHCRYLVVSSDKPPRIIADEGRCRWIGKSTVDTANISTGAVKIWDLVRGKQLKRKAKKSKSAKDVTPGAIKQFFKVKVPVTAEPEVVDEASRLQRKRRKLVIVESDSE